MKRLRVAYVPGLGNDNSMPESLNQSIDMMTPARNEKLISNES